MSRPGAGPLWCGVVALVAASPDSAVAQIGAVNAAVEATVTNRYVWRGVTRHPGFTAQALGALTVPVGQWVGVHATGWGTWVAGGCDCSVAAYRDGALRAADLNLSLSVDIADPRLGLVDVLTVGANRSSARPTPWDPSQDRAATTEVFVQAASRPSQHLQWSLTGWYDLDRVDGGYLEGNVTFPFALRLGARTRFFVSGAVGMNVGQSDTEKGRPVPGYFAENGFTHLALEVAVLLANGGRDGRRTAQAFVRLQGNFDDRAKARSPWDSTEREQRVWFGLSVRNGRGAR